MKHTAIIICLLTFSSLCHSQPHLIQTESDWQRVLSQMTRDQKPILIDFYTTWCAPCKQMDKTVLSQDTVKTFLEHNFIAVKVDADKALGKVLKKKFAVEAYPTYVYLDAESIPAHTLIGYKSADLFVQESRNALILIANAKPLQYFQVRYSAGERSPLFVQTYIRKLLSANADSLAIPALTEYLSTLDSSALASADIIDLLATAVRDCQHPYFPILEKVRNQPIADVKLNQTVVRCYRLALDRCLQKATENKDSSLFEQVLRTVGHDPNNLTPEESIMNVRLKFYEQIDSTKTLYFKWMAYYMERKKTMTRADLVSGADRAFDKIYKNKPTGMPERNAFIEKWVKGDTESIALQLSYYSTQFFQAHQDPEKRAEALAWSQHSCELMPIPDHLDVYAHLLYWSGNKVEALTQQRKAIGTAILEGQDKQPFEVELSKMIQGKL